MSHAEPITDLWEPPDTFRDGLADVERLAGLLLEQLHGQLVVPADQVEFIARRLHQLARDAHRALPPEVI